MCRSEFVPTLGGGRIVRTGTDLFHIFNLYPSLTGQMYDAHDAPILWFIDLNLSSTSDIFSKIKLHNKSMAMYLQSFHWSCFQRNLQWLTYSYCAILEWLLSPVYCYLCRALYLVWSESNDISISWFIIIA